MSPSQVREPSAGPQAVVIGSGVAGLLAARALSTHFRRVTVVERDPEPVDAQPRAGVPQSNQFHVLLEGGQRAIEALLPGFLSEVEAAGGPLIDFGPDLAWLQFGRWKSREPTGFKGRPMTRPQLELMLRQRVAGLPGVRFRYGVRATKLRLDAAGGVTGVELDGSAAELLCCDLLVDASGRSSALPRWLADGGFLVPEDERLEVNLKYCTGIFELPETALPNPRAILLSPTPPHGYLGGVAQPLSRTRFIVSVFGYHGHHPTAELSSMLGLSRELGDGCLYRLLSAARPISPLRVHGFPFMRWSHYERLRRFPRGLLALGDVLCSFDPVYGQGMSIAAQEAVLLEHLLASHRASPDLARRFFKGCAQRIATPWAMASGDALRFVETTGRRPIGLPILHAYVEAVVAACTTRADVYRSLLRVMHLLDPPSALFRPSVLWPTLRLASGRRAAGTEDRARS